LAQRRRVRCSVRQRYLLIQVRTVRRLKTFEVKGALRSTGGTGRSPDSVVTVPEWATDVKQTAKATIILVARLCFLSCERFIRFGGSRHDRKA
jgi:hypothetical protein